MGKQKTSGAGKAKGGAGNSITAAKTPAAPAPNVPPAWPQFKPQLPVTDLVPDKFASCPDKVVLIRNFWPKSLCSSYVTFLRNLPLVTTPGRPKRGDAVRVNDRFQVQDATFAQRLWMETGLREALSQEDVRGLWGGEVVGLNPNIRIYRYSKGQYFDAHFLFVFTLLVIKDFCPSTGKHIDLFRRPKPCGSFHTDPHNGVIILSPGACESDPVNPQHPAPTNPSRGAKRPNSEHALPIPSLQLLDPGSDSFALFDTFLLFLSPVFRAGFPPSSSLQDRSRPADHINRPPLTDDDSNNVSLALDPSSGQTPCKTTWTLLLYLTSSAEGCVGGETVFFPNDRRSAKEEIPVALETGMALLHKHGDDCMLHEGREVTAGEKWVLRTDLCVRK